MSVLTELRGVIRVYRAVSALDAVFDFYERWTCYGV